MSVLNNKNYFSIENQNKYMSVSQFKTFEKCPALALAELKAEYQRPMTKDLLVGSYVDAYFEGSLGEFISKHPELFTRTGELKAEYRQAEDIIKRIQRDKMFMEYMSGDKQVIYTGEINGVAIKIKVDSMHKDKIVDLKIMRDFKPIYVAGEGKQSFIEAWGYDLQGAVYQEIVRQNTGLKLPFYIAGATKEKTTDIRIFAVPQELLDFELSRFAEKVMYYDGIKKGLFEAERCEKCDYCKETRVLTNVMDLEELNDEYSGN